MNKDRRRIRGCSNKEMRKLILALMDSTRYRMTVHGIMFYGPHGTATVHLTESDHRALNNFRSLLRGIGIETKGK
ncbi:hypothetical protein SEA_BRUHMOMENT_65 [Arthrobacter phage BruhMoment]|nr:hypothetical protein SEA_BRUHMOMENT_65 [Arthrobacter phage BruhMoment]